MSDPADAFRDGTYDKFVVEGADEQEEILTALLAVGDEVISEMENDLRSRVNVPDTASDLKKMREEIEDLRKSYPQHEARLGPFAKRLRELADEASRLF